MQKVNAEKMLEKAGRNNHCICTVNLNEKGVPTCASTGHDHFKKLETASLEAENRKTEAIMEAKRRSFT